MESQAPLRRYSNQGQMAGQLVVGRALHCIEVWCAIIGKAVSILYFHHHFDVGIGPLLVVIIDMPEK